jgi:hypothetical protein
MILFVGAAAGVKIEKPLKQYQGLFNFKTY